MLAMESFRRQYKYSVNYICIGTCTINMDWQQNQVTNTLWYVQKHVFKIYSFSMIHQFIIAGRTAWISPDGR